MAATMPTKISGHPMKSGYSSEGGRCKMLKLKVARG